MSDYEFTEQQNEVIAGVSRKLKLAGVLLAVLGFLAVGTSIIAIVIAVARPSVLLAPPSAEGAEAQRAPIAQIQPTVTESPKAAATGMMVGALTSLIFAAVYLLIARWNRSAGRYFEAITTTSGDDIPLLLKALDRLAEIYKLQRNLVVVCFLLIVGLFVGGMVLALVLLSVM